MVLSEETFFSSMTFTEPFDICTPPNLPDIWAFVADDASCFSCAVLRTLTRRTESGLKSFRQYRQFCFCVCLFH